jgi:hypothetical protein
MVRAEVREALAPLRDRLDEIERSLLETIVRISKSSSAAPASPTLDLAPETRDMRSGLLSWLRASVGDRKRRLLMLALGAVVVAVVGTIFILMAAGG